MAKLGVCVIGAGDMGRTHSRAWAAIPEAELIAVADPQMDRAEGLKEQFGFRIATPEWREAIEAPGVNVVSVCVPTAFHRECAEAAMERGLHVLCEKPIALSEQDAISMIATAQRTGVKFAIGFCKRFSRLIQALRDTVQAGTLGRPVFYRFVTGWEIRFKPWIMSKEYGGGPLVDFACHFFDQWRVIFGSDPVRVKASGATFSAGAPELEGLEPQVDTGTVLVEYESGDIGMISVSWGLARGTRSDTYEDLIGPRGATIVHGLKGYTIRTPDGEQTVEGLDEPNMYQEQIRAFADAVLNDKPVAASGMDGLVALKVSLAALRSINTGETVEIALA